MTRFTPRARFGADATPADPDQLFDVAVLGAGVVGVASAYALARRGARVVLVDRQGGPGQGASHANGAQLSYAYADALGSPALLGKLPALALGLDPLFRLRFDPDLIGWGLRFLAASSAAGARRHTLEILRLALESQQAMHRLLQHHALSFAHAAPGKMHLYFDRRALAGAEQGAAAKRRLGVEQQVLGADEARRIEPALAGAHGLVGVVHSPADEVGDPWRFCQALARVNAEEHGVEPRFGFDARSIACSAEALTLVSGSGERVRARTLVVAAGIESRALLAHLGVRVPLAPMKGYSFNVAPGPGAPRLSLTDTARRLVFCPLDGMLRIAGGAELGAGDATVDPARLQALIDQARASLPEAADYGQASGGWAGLRPMTPTSAPIIARAGPRLVLNIGHGMLGWTLAMGSAERAAALVLENCA